MSKSVWALKKLVVALIGFPLVVLGIILIPLPGPGLVVIFLGLLLLSTEFEWAQRYADTAKAQMKTIYEKSKARADKINKD